MFILQKVLSAFIEIPGIFFSCGLIFFLFSRKKFSKRYWISFFVIFSFLYLCCTEIFVNPLIILFEDSVNAGVLDESLNNENSLIVILGSGIQVIKNNENSEPLVELSDTALQRLNHGICVFRKTGSNIVLSGGVVPLRPEISEAQVMKKNLMVWGVPEEKIFLETLSRNTNENALNSINIADERIKKIFLVTSALHMKRALSSFNKAVKTEKREMEIIPQPCDFKVERENFSIYSFLPSSANLEHLQFLIHEILGGLFYGIRGL